MRYCLCISSQDNFSPDIQGPPPAPVFLCACVHMQWCLSRPEANLQCHFSGASNHVFERGYFTGTQDWLIRPVEWPESFKYSLVSTLLVLEVQVRVSFDVSGGNQIRSSWLVVKTLPSKLSFPALFKSSLK